MKRQKKKRSTKEKTDRRRDPGKNKAPVILSSKNMESYPMEDRALKEAARFMGEELLKVLLTSLMDGELSQEARVRRSLEILKNEQEHVEQGQMVPMQSVLYALAMKVLNADELKKIKEMMTMTLLGQMLMEDGIEKGIMKGEFKNMQDLIRDGLLSVETAASRKHMTVEEFQQKLRELELM